jgi:hypothetical protein
MELEIKEAERKLAEKKEEEKKKLEEQSSQINTNTTTNTNTNTEKKEEKKEKDVFAKFKNYNKNTSVQSASVPIDRPVPQKNTKEQEEKIVKEKANRYSYEGKFANYHFLKKVDRKIVDKRYAMSFAEFKKMQKNTD